MDALNSVLTPIRPALQTITQNLPKPLNDFSISLLGSQCHTTLLHNIDLSAGNLPCLNLAISKGLGVAIIAVSAIVKVPQLLKLLSSQSAAGLSFLSYLLETASFIITLAYSARRGFPFSTYGETALVALQDVAITLLILVFSGQATWGLSFLIAVASVAYALFSAKMVPMDQLSYLQAGAGVLSVASKVPQIVTVWSEGGTGQLSAFAVFNYLAGSLARIFTTIQEVDDNLILYGYLAGFALNAILAAQMIYYWNSPATAPHANEAKLDARLDASRPQEKSAMSTGTDSGSGTPASEGTPRGPSTRRRG